MRLQESTVMTWSLALLIGASLTQPAYAQGSGYAGLEVTSMQALTNDQVVRYGAPYETWVTLATMQHYSRTLEVLRASLTGECSKVGSGTIRIRLLVDGKLAQPGGYNRQFCMSPSTSSATHMANWVHAVNAGNHTLQVQFLLTGGSAAIDDWVFDLVAHRRLPLVE
jgi:hypothetical protein